MNTKGAGIGSLGGAAAGAIIGSRAGDNFVFGGSTRLRDRLGGSFLTYESSLTVQERVTSLFQQEPAIPYQYFETFGRKSYLAPEERLVLAVLEEGIICFQKFVGARHRKGKRLFREAEDWILEEDSERLFSFENVCEVLGLDPGHLRHGLMRWKEKSLTQSLEAKHPLTHKTMKKKCKRKKFKVAA